MLLTHRELPIEELKIFTNKLERGWSNCREPQNPFVVGYKITSQARSEIVFDREILPHAIVMVSELIPFGDWDDLVIETMEKAIMHNMMIHILDLQELATIARFSKDVNQFDYYLVQRFKHFVEKRTFFIRTVPASP